MRWLAALVIALTMALSACGGSDNGDDAKQTDAAVPERTEAAEPPPAVGGGAPSRGLSKPQYIKRADRVCRTARAQLIPIRSKIVSASKGSDPAVVFRRYAALTGRAAAVYSGALGQIEGLDPPARDQAQIDMVNALLEQIAGIMRQNSAAAAAQDSAKLKALNLQANAVADRYRMAAKAYGFRDCGQTVGALERRGNR